MVEEHSYHIPVAIQTTGTEHGFVHHAVHIIFHSAELAVADIGAYLQP